MKNTLSIISTFLTSVLFGQKTFTNTYNVEAVGNYKYSFDNCRSILEYSNSLYTIGTLQENRENTSSASDGISDTTHAMLMKYDLTGNLIYCNFYTPNSCSSDIYNHILKNGILIAGGSILSPKNYCGIYNPDNPPPGVDLITKSRIYFTATDLTSGNFKQAVYRTGVSSSPFGIVNSNDANYMIGTFVEKDRSVRFLKINEKLDSLETKLIFDSVPSNYYPTYLAKTTNGYVVLLVSDLDNASHFEVLDNNANTVSYINFPFVIPAISQTQDNGFIAISKGTQTVTTLVKLNQQLTTEWTKTYPVYATSFVKQVKDGNYILGNKDFAKVNKDSVIWKRRYFGPDNIQPWYFLFDAIETSDNGFALTGFYDANTLLIKTDCLGNTIWDGQTCDIKADPIKPETIFPNPFKDEITFQLTDLDVSNPVIIRITNALGQIVYQESYGQNSFTLNASSLPVGVYFYTAISGKKTHKSGKLLKL